MFWLLNQSSSEGFGFLLLPLPRMLISKNGNNWEPGDKSQSFIWKFPRQGIEINSKPSMKHLFAFRFYFGDFRFTYQWELRLKRNFSIDACKIGQAIFFLSPCKIVANVTVLKRETKFFRSQTSDKVIFWIESPGLTAIVKHGDHAMTWYDHGDSYSPMVWSWQDHAMQPCFSNPGCHVCAKLVFWTI